MDYLSVLGATQGDTFSDLRKKARDLFRKYHSDKSHNPQSEEKFRQVYEAYKYVRENPSVLKNSEKEDNRYIAFTVKASLQDFYLGTEKSILVRRNRYCTSCSGTGSSNGLSGRCPACDGKGSIKGKVARLMGLDGKCSQCLGSGWISGNSCKKCNGSKFTTEEVRVPVSLDVHSYKKKSAIIVGEGHQIGPNLFGNILINIEIEQSDLIRIEDDYFCIYAKVLPIQKIIGDKAEIEIFGRKLPFTIERGESEAWVEDHIKPGKVQKVRILFFPLQPEFTEETLILYKKILEIEKTKIQ